MMDLPAKCLNDRERSCLEMVEERLVNRIYEIDGRPKETVTVKKRFRKLGQACDPKTAPFVENVYTFPINDNFTIDDIRRKGMVEIDLPERDPAGYAEMKRLAREEVEAEMTAKEQDKVEDTPSEQVSAAESVEMEVGSSVSKPKMKRGQPRKS